MYKWNPVFNLIMEIKNKFIEINGEISSYGYVDNSGIKQSQLEYWIDTLGESNYSKFIEPIQLTQHNEFLLVRYSLQDMKPEMWENEDSIYRECRSVVIDLKRNSLVLTPFKKFFNLNEIPENDECIIRDKLLTSKSVEITDKMDGSMQIARWYNNNIFMSGSQALDMSQSWRLKEGYNMLTPSHTTMLRENSNYTFIFEYISLKDAHVVNYNKQQEGLYLIGIRDVYSGRHLSYNEIKKYSDKYNVSMTLIEDETFDNIIEKSKSIHCNNKEGWVINIDGHLIKLKCDDYIKVHRILNQLSSINAVIEHVANNTSDDLLSKVPISHKEKVSDLISKVKNYVIHTNNEINKYYINAPKCDRKTFMLWVNNNCPNNLKGYVRAKYLDEDFNVLRSGTRKNYSYKKARHLNLEIE